MLSCGSTGGRSSRHTTTIMASWRSVRTRQSNVDLWCNLFWCVTVGQAGRCDPKAGSLFSKQFLVPMALKRSCRNYLRGQSEPISCSARPWLVVSTFMFHESNFSLSWRRLVCDLWMNFVYLNINSKWLIFNYGSSWSCKKQNTWLPSVFWPSSSSSSSSYAQPSSRSCCSCTWKKEN